MIGENEGLLVKEVGFNQIMQLIKFTHPDIATLVTPLCFAKRGIKKKPFGKEKTG
jgi:hypothetical protein